MQSLQLTPTERVEFSDQIKTEITAPTTSTTVLTFDNYDSIALVVEYDTESNNAIFSVKLTEMTGKTPEGFLGCPTTLRDVNSPPVEAFCEEVDTVLENEFGVEAEFAEGDFTVYEWETDTAWYLYEVSVPS